jgi:heat shock protein HtpX
MERFSGYLKTTVLLGGLTGLLIVVGGVFGGESGMVIAFLVATVMNLGAYWFSDKIVLATYRARPLQESEAPQVHAIVAELAQRGGMPMPRLYLLPQKAPNAFATGRNPQHAAVAVTHGLLELMNRDELEGVLAHEMSHVANRDILISSVAATLAGAVMLLARFAGFAAIFGGYDRRDGRGGGLELLATMLLAPLAAVMIQLWVSRTREYAADASGAELAGSPHGLASALRKLDAYGRKIPMREASPATAHLFIVAPLGAGRGLAGLFSTHPPLEERVRRLLARSA